MSDEPLTPDAIALAEDAAALRDAMADDVTPPGLADVLRRAAEGLPELGTLEEAELAAALDAMPDSGEICIAAFGGLEDFIDAARGNADALTAARAKAPIPAMPRPAATQRNALVPVLIAIAAVLLLVPALWAGLSVTLLDPAATVDTSGEAALQSLEQGETSEPFVERKSAPRSKASRPVPARVPDPDPTPDADPDPVPDEEIEIVLDDPKPSSTRAPSRPSLGDRLALLDAEAHAAWKVGDLGLAEDKFREIVRAGRRGKAADLAYGDLFSIARQRSDKPGLRRYWKQYAEKFPRGRWIDDARAGLCRTAASDRSRSCWEAYLRDRPHGTYRRDAEAALR